MSEANGKGQETGRYATILFSPAGRGFGGRAPARSGATGVSVANGRSGATGVSVANGRSGATGVSRALGNEQYLDKLKEIFRKKYLPLIVWEEQI